MPKILADENVPHLIVELLQRKKIDVLWVPNSARRGSSDVELLAVANAQKRIILTMDKDFTDSHYLTRTKTGVIYLKLRISKENAEWTANLVSSVIKRTKGKIVTVDAEYAYIEKI